MPTLIEKGFVPLSEIDQKEPSGRVFIDLNLPDYVNTDNIGVNLPRIEKICSLSGIEVVSIAGVNGDTSKEVPVVTGVNKDGSAMAGKAVEKVTAPTFAHLQGPLPIHEDMGRRTTALLIGVNISELSKKASESEAGSRDTLIWAKNLDSAVKTPLRKAGTENLISHWDLNSKLYYLTMPGIIGLIDAVASTNVTSEQYAGQLVALSLTLRAVEYIETHKDMHFRHSLFVGPQLDRALALQIKTRTQNIIADLHPDKK
jgi:hypothetical protein